ncbi:hypothetical protein LIER_40828 [Lithospermum erythrorhizon]|uniref:CCHC-type domain-containing protein n=1 Tax=Lithospermum erythrorhizon TaxID=34254 RepID=A0AAV3R495_LITER
MSCVPRHNVWRIKRDLRSHQKEDETNIVSIFDPNQLVLVNGFVHGGLDKSETNSQKKRGRYMIEGEFFFCIKVWDMLLENVLKNPNPTLNATSGRSHAKTLPKNKKKKKWVCHHCGNKGHIRPY